MEFSQLLIGHTCPENAYVVDDYPYGFTLRCKIRYWIETKEKHGQRFCSQTTNPKRSSEVWNKPKYSTYFPLVVMGLDAETGYVEYKILSQYADENEVVTFGQKYVTALQSKYSQETIQAFRIGKATHRHACRLASVTNIYDIPADQRRDIIRQAGIIAIREVADLTVN